MATILELRKQAQNLKSKEDYDNALPLFRQIWDLEENDWNGYYFAQCLRKTGNYSEAREIQSIIKTNYPNFKPITSEELWLDFNEKIKDWKNPELFSDAEELLSKTNRYDKYTGKIFNKTVLNVVKKLIYSNENDYALFWLDKLDFTVLSNSPFTIKEQKYASDQKVFFVRYADILIKLNKHVEYLESYLSCVGIEGAKQIQFKKYILENITFKDWQGYTHITRLKLALYIKFFKEEIDNRTKNTFTKIFVPNKITTISELGDFEFCPVSFAVSTTYEIVSNASWEKDEWLGEKKHLIDRYKDYQKNKNLSEVFMDSAIEINETLKADFNDIFNSKLIINNFDGLSKTYFSNLTDTIRGNPNYVFESANGNRFAVIEKFTKRTSEGTLNAFNNDLARIYGYIFELATLKIDFGYLIYWYWQVDDFYDDKGNLKKKMRIRAYRIFKIEKNAENRKRLTTSIERIENFKRTSKLLVNGDKISYPNKCLNCSVVSYCNHKTGKFDVVNLPYDVSSISINEQPSTSINNSASIDVDDLPF